MAIKTTTLTSTECWAINSYLHSAALKMKELAKTAELTPNGGLMQQAFENQYAECIEFASLFAVADAATLIEDTSDES